jgi:hypothetical protein
MTSIAAAVLAAAISLTAGCAAPEPTEPALPQPVAVIDNAAQLHLPIADQLPSDHGDEVVGRAAVVLTEACARRFGVHYTARFVANPGLLEGADRRYGVIDVAEAARSGYGRPGKPTDGGKQWDPSAREYEVVTGRTPAGGPTTVRTAGGTPVPAGGCAQEAWQRLHAGDDDLVTLVDGLLNETWTQTTADSRARAAETSWVECMRAAGHDFHHRWDAAASVGTAPPEQQRAMAELDATCARRVNYVGIWHAVDSAYQRRAIAQLGDRLPRALAAQRALVARASEVVRAGK